MFQNLRVQIALLIVIAAVHGWLAVKLAVFMLFRPYSPVRILGFTVWPQGMIPRQQDRLAQAIGNAVGNELVSQETVLNALFETEFFKRKVESFIAGYTDEILTTPYPSLVDLLPAPVRVPVLDAISQLQFRISEYIAFTLKSEETAAAVAQFIDQRVDDLLGQSVEQMLGAGATIEVVQFVESRFAAIVSEPVLAEKIYEFVSARVDEIAASNATVGELFAQDAIAVIKDRMAQQVPPIVHQLAEIATQNRTRTQIGALIKKEVDDYYEHLSFFKRIFISRERIHKEVDDLVNSTLPQKVEEYLRGEAFASEAQTFLSDTVDNLTGRPIREVIGEIAPEKLDVIKEQITARVVILLRSEEIARSISVYATDALAQLRSQALSTLLDRVSPDATSRVKGFMTHGLLGVLAREETARTVNGILNTQIERLLVSPIGKLGDYVSEESTRTAGHALTVRIMESAYERLPAAIAEFDIGGIVRKKVAEYPLPRLEALVLSVAQRHLRTIELFGAVIGFIVGIIQAFYFWLTHK